MRLKKLALCLFVFLVLVNLTSCSKNTNTSNSNDNNSITTTELTNNKEEKYNMAYSFMENKCSSYSRTQIYSVGTYSIMYKNEGDGISFYCLNIVNDASVVLLYVPKKMPTKYTIIYTRHTLSSFARFDFGRLNLNTLDFYEFNGYQQERQEDYSNMKTEFSLLLGAFIDYIFINTTLSYSELGI